MASGPKKAFCLLVFSLNKTCCYSSATVLKKLREDSLKNTINSCLVRGSERPVQKLITKFSVTFGRLNIGLILLEQFVALTMNFISEQILLIKVLK